MHRRTWLLTIASSSITTVAAGAIFSRTHPRPRYSIPNRRYQYKKLLGPVVSLSKPPATVATDALNRETKTFQFVDTPRLQIDHCLVERLAVVLHANGDYVLSLRAIQNPTPVQLPSTRNVTNAGPVQLQTDRFRRNRFHIKLSFLNQLGTAPATNVGDPVLAQVWHSFWVERGQPLLLRKTGRAPSAITYFPIINLAAIEFRYEK